MITYLPNVIYLANVLYSPNVLYSINVLYLPNVSHSAKVPYSPNVPYSESLFNKASRCLVAIGLASKREYIINCFNNVNFVLPGRPFISVAPYFVAALLSPSASIDSIDAIIIV